MRKNAVLAEIAQALQNRGSTRAFNESMYLLFQEALESSTGETGYLDDNHVTATYLDTMSSIVEQAIDSALGWRQPETPM
jgi:hypothetical protein